MARENRQFLGRAVSYVAGRGIGQFIDVGAGLPTAVNTHDVACRAAPGARVAYVDNDPVVLAHAQALLATAPGVVAVAQDFRAAYSAARLYFHTPDEIVSFFAGLDLVPPGVLPVRGWDGDAPRPELEPRLGTFLAGVGRRQS